MTAVYVEKGKQPFWVRRDRENICHSWTLIYTEQYCNFLKEIAVLIVYCNAHVSSWGTLFEKKLGSKFSEKTLRPNFPCELLVNITVPVY